MGTEQRWLVLEEAAAYLRCSERFLRDLVTARAVPHCVLAGKTLFFRDRLDEWLLGMEVSPEVDAAAPAKEGKRDLVDLIRERTGLDSRDRSRYINFSYRNKVKFQLHPSPTGIDLAVPEADEKLPPCEVLEPVPIAELHGYWGPNKDWLAGNGQRFTIRPAAAFHVPEKMKDDPNHPGWGEIDALLKYATER